MNSQNDVWPVLDKKPAKFVYLTAFSETKQQNEVSEASEY